MDPIKCRKCGTPIPSGSPTCTRCGLPAPPPPSRQGQDSGISLRPGQILANRYTVKAMIGRGGMGCIYNVQDNTLNEEVALKTLLPRFANDKLVLDRFFNEARIARQLSHPNIVRVHDIGISGGVIYISMEYVRGKSLRHLLEDVPPGERLPVRQTLAIMDQLCAALEYAHRYTVHRDIKPENVMLDEHGTVKLMDFGISKLRTGGNVTSVAMIMGTPVYMSPEQLRDSSSVDGRADLYSLGVMLYEILTGNLPTGVPRPASQITYDVPPALDPIVARCMEPDPDRRYPNAQALREDLRPIRELVESHTGFTPGVTATRTADRARARKRVRRIAGAALLLLVLAVSFLGIRALEARRKETLDEARRAHEAAQSQQQARTAPAWAYAGHYAELDRRIEQARALLAGSAASVAGVNADFLSLGDAFRRQAAQAAGREDPDALRHAWWALQCYLGPLLAPEDMVFVPPGEVAPAAEGDSGPAVIEGFFIERTEVTNADYRAFAEDQARGGWRYPPGFEGVLWDDEFAEAPVAMVTLYDAIAYAAWRGRILPTQAEWARAAYGASGASDRFPWGDAPGPGVGERWAARAAADHPARVGTFPEDVTAFGCHDMAGNVSEWTRSPLRGEDEAVSATPFGEEFVIRGGNWQDAQPVPLSDRRSAPFETMDPALGFRCALAFPTRLEDIDTRLADIAGTRISPQE